jgi:hypothetical protein
MTDTTNQVATDGVTWTNTHAMPWSRFGGLDAGRVKVLHEDEEGTPWVMIVWLPPGDLGIELPHRHVHKTVYEHAYHLAGDLPHDEWASYEADHTVAYMREGYFLDRKPNSIHGNDFLFSDTGCVILCWRSGTGNWLHDEGAEIETPNMDFPDTFRASTMDRVQQPEFGTGLVVDRPDAKMYSTRDMLWAPLGELEGARVKVLVRDTEGNPTVRMLYVPPGDQAVEPMFLEDGDHQFSMVIEGELPVVGPEGTMLATPGWVARRAPGAPDPLVPAEPSVTGAVVFQFRFGANSFPFPETTEA